MNTRRPATIPCNSDCGAKFQPVGQAPVSEQMRAAGWRVFDGTTSGGKPLSDVRCPTCSKPDPAAAKAAAELAKEVR